MKVLLSYDKSDCAQHLIDNLRTAGLPFQGKVLVVGRARTDTQPAFVPDEIQHKIETCFPNWELCSENASGPSDNDVLNISRWWRPDLLVVCSNAEIAHQARCSVRVVRPNPPHEDGPLRLLLGNDGSREAAAMTTAVARRAWPAGTEAKVISIVDAGDSERFDALSVSSTKLANELRRVGLKAHEEVIYGNPHGDLVRQAEAWNADTIFIAGHPASPARLIMGSTATAVLTRARCAVEVTR